MPYRIKSRVYDVNKKLVDLMSELKQKNIDIAPSLFSDYINERRTGKNADKVLSICDEIIKKWEKERKAKSCKSKSRP